MATYMGQTVDIYEDFEDATLATGLTEVDTEGILHVADTTQYHGGSASLEIDMDSWIAAEATIGYAFTAVNNLSFGFWYRTGHYDDWSGGPVFFIIKQLVVDNNMRIRDVQDGNSAATRNIGCVEGGLNGPVTDATWYWITGQYNRNATSYWSIYADTTHALVDSDSYTAPNRPCDIIYVPNISGHRATVVYIDDFVADITDATYPLLGWEVAAGGSIVPLAMMHYRQMRAN